MDGTVEVSIPVEPAAAAALRDARTRQAIGRVVSRMLHPRAGQTALIEAMDRLRADAEARGLTDAIIDAELAAYNAEQRG